MQESSARKRFKVLQRERDRLLSSGRSCAEVEAAIATIVKDFPQLNVEYKPLSAATAALLAYGEAISADQVIAQEPSRPDDPVPKDATAASTSSPWGSVAVLNSIVVLAAVVRVVNDVLSKSTLPPLSVLKCCVVSALCAIVHRNILEPCEGGWALDPLIFTLGIHAAHCLAPFLSSRCGNSDRRTRVEAIFVYVVRDVIPSLCCSFVVYSVVMVIQSGLGAKPVRLFC
jgi:hypothetical protein